MKLLTPQIIFGALLLFTRLAAGEAPLSVKISEFTFSGISCSEETARGTIAPEGESYSILLDEMSVQWVPGQPLDRKVCEIVFKVDVPAGYKRVDYKFDWRGFSFFTPFHWGVFKTTYYRLNSRGRWSFLKQSTKNWGPRHNNEFLWQQALRSTQSSSLRGQDHPEVLRLRIELSTRSFFKKQGEGLLQLDSLDGVVEGFPSPL